VAVLRYDLTGLGGSDGHFIDTSFSTNLADLKAAIRFAAGELGDVTALIGHSFGGAVSLALAATEPPDTLGAIVTLAAPSDTKHLAILLSAMDPAIDRDGVGKVVIGGREWTISREMLDDFRRYDLPELVTHIDRPTLLMHSPVDQTVGFDHALRIMGLIQASPRRSTPVSLLSIADADHLLSESGDDLHFAASAAAAFIHRYRGKDGNP
jgi:putative redox protein